MEPAPHHRHQSSLEGFFGLSSSPPMEDDERNQAIEKFYQIIEHYENNQVASSGPYNRPALIRLVFEYAMSETSKDNILNAFFAAIGSPMDQQGSIDLSIKETDESIKTLMIGFADYLIDNFFLPLRASTNKTPQPSPVYHSATQSTRAGRQEFVGTTNRLETLRGDCLQRDRHRCIISRLFDQDEAIKRMETSGENYQDDDGHTLAGQSFETLEVAHILPHSLVKTGSNSKLDESRQAALKILNMFDHNVAHLIEGPEIDRPRNALTLTHSLHLRFGQFRIYFEPVSEEPNTYQIESFLSPSLLNNIVPVTRTLYLTEARVIEPPSPRFLAIHRAIAHILHLSAAGDFINRMLQDLDEEFVRADGSTELGRLVHLRISA